MRWLRNRWNRIHFPSRKKKRIIAALVSLTLSNNQHVSIRTRILYLTLRESNALHRCVSHVIKLPRIYSKRVELLHSKRFGTMAFVSPFQTTHQHRVVYRSAFHMRLSRSGNKIHMYIRDKSDGPAISKHMGSLAVCRSTLCAHSNFRFHSFGSIWENDSLVSGAAQSQAESKNKTKNEWREKKREK